MIAPPEIRLSLGAVVHDVKGHAYVFVGYRTSTVSTNLYFVRGETCSLYSANYEYRAVARDTLVRKFPDILEHEILDRELGSELPK